MSNPVTPRLLFVYAADSGIVNTVIHFLHKIVRPETYPCSLCAVTYGSFSERPQWREYLNTLDVPQEFLHRDELEAAFPVHGIPLPCVLLDTGAGLEPLVSAEELNRITTLDALISLMKTCYPRSA